jgi:hypothetical protein
LEWRQFRAAEASGEVKQVASALAEALNSESPTERLHSEAVGRMFTVGQKLKPEIPVYFLSAILLWNFYRWRPNHAIP